MKYAETWLTPDDLPKRFKKSKLGLAPSNFIELSVSEKKGDEYLEVYFYDYSVVAVSMPDACASLPDFIRDEHGLEDDNAQDISFELQGIGTEITGCTFYHGATRGRVADIVFFRQGLIFVEIYYIYPSEEKHPVSVIDLVRLLSQRISEFLKKNP